MSSQQETHTRTWPEPARWLLEHHELISTQAPGHALDVACGSGRHAFLLHELGFEVDAVDVDSSAVQELRRRAAACNARIRVAQADVTGIRLPRSFYSVIVNTNFLERCLFSPLSAALAPSGLLIFETFTRDHVEVLKNRMNPAFLLEPNELLRAFGGLRVLHYREGVVNDRHPRAVASLVGASESAIA
ncbi:MAG: class I SAM-dependent methyltransferase [Solirubrobacteraceae bacterium]